MVQDGLRSVQVLAIGFVLLAFASSGALAADEPVEVVYVGGGFIDHGLADLCSDALGEPECPVPVPTGVMSAPCDGDGAFSIGGVIFCGVPVGTTVTLSIDDAVFDDAEAVLYCSNGELGVLRGSMSLAIPTSCAEDDGTTTLFVLIVAGTATTGTVFLQP